MIPRYEKKEISSLWTEEAKFHYFLKAEIALLEALEEEQMIPSGVAKKFSKAKINIDRIHEIEKVTKHDVIAFCSSITEQVDERYSKYFHYGVTSSDIIDTALSLQIRDSLNIALSSLENLLQAIKTRALEHKNTLCIGRSHGMYAEPMSFGAKLLSFYTEWKRRYEDLKIFSETELTAQFSGAVGNYTILTPKVEKLAAMKLHLNVEELSTQVIPRDRIAKLISITSLMGAALERVSIEIRHLSRSDVAEAAEGFAKGQKGSSTMPHKKNPISAENLTGIARMLRSHIHVALENTLLWHERDISHSSAERMMLPDAFGLLVYGVDRLCSTINDLVVLEDNIEKRIRDNFTYLSSYYLHKLIDQCDLTREEIYPIVQDASFNAKDAQSFHGIIEKEVKKKGQQFKLNVPTQSEIKNIYLANIDDVYKRCLGTI